jgi:hypothetical protein
MKTLEQHLADWDNEVKQENARFTFKHAIRLQGLFLDDQNRIYTHKGNLYAELAEVGWRDANTIEARVKLQSSLTFAMVTIDIGKLR